MTVGSRHHGRPLALAWLLLQLRQVVLGMQGRRCRCRQRLLVTTLLVPSSMLDLLLIVVLLLLLEVVQHALLLVLLPVLQMLWRDVDDRGTISIHGFVALPAGRGLMEGALWGDLGHGSLSIPCVLEELVNCWHSTLFILCQTEDSVSICSWVYVT